MQKKRFYIWMIILIISVIILGMIAAAIGPAGISLKELWKIIIGSNEMNRVYKTILFKIRIPRIILSYLVGAALATAGVIMQGLIQNPMADPYIVGTSAGAGLGATIAIVFNLNFKFMGLSTVPLFAFVGAVLAVFLVYQLARQGSKVPVVHFLLAGMAVGFLLGALTSLVMVLGIKDHYKIVYWLMGSLAKASWKEVYIILPYLVTGLFVTLYIARDLNLILLGEETAHNMGVNVEQLKRIVLITAALLTASAVSVSGVIGFVGLIIPHIVRMITGPDHRRLIPAASIFGGGFLMLSDTIARTVAAPTEIPVGVITALFGGPFFLYQLRKSRKI
ncbi:FecCD family ABC transporter permease [Anoxybacter fermentans]|nr:iron chelate uptake ABC transporter family permease subunit [Anoxybacter fermentans]